MSDPRSDPAPSMLDEVDLAGLAPGAAFEAVGVELEVTGAADVGGRAVLGLATGDSAVRRIGARPARQPPALPDSAAGRSKP